MNTKRGDGVGTGEVSRYEDKTNGIVVEVLGASMVGYRVRVRKN